LNNGQSEEEDNTSSNEIGSAGVLKGIAVVQVRRSIDRQNQRNDIENTDFALDLDLSFTKSKVSLRPGSHHGRLSLEQTDVTNCQADFVGDNGVCVGVVGTVEDEF